MIYAIGKHLVRAFLHLYFGFSVSGEENIPKEGPILVCGNHQSNWDPPVVGCAMNRQTGFMAKEELFKNKFTGGLLSRLGAFPIKRARSDQSAIRELLKRFKEGKSVVVFPQGTRQRPGRPPVKAKPGIIKIAILSGVPIVPAAISANYKFRGRVSVRFGAPITFSGMDKKALTDEKLSEIADGLMDTIYGLCRESTEKDGA